MQYVGNRQNGFSGIDALRKYFRFLLFEAKLLQNAVDFGSVLRKQHVPAVGFVVGKRRFFDLFQTKSTLHKLL